jgi:type II secretory pathway pseudopilin PulG
VTSKRHNQHGFTLIATLMAAVIVGIGILVAVEPWQTITRREKEKELLYRGGAIRKAIERYYRESPGGRQSYPEELKNLLQDDRYPGQPRRYLRRLYKDPITEGATTEGDWVFIFDGNQRIKGVRSASEAPPIKMIGFPEEFKDFEGKTKYSEWVFQFTPGATPVPPAGKKPTPTPTPIPTPTN